MILRSGTKKVAQHTGLFTICGFVYKTQLFAKSPKIQYVSNVLCALGPTLRWDSNDLEILLKSVQTLSPTTHIAPICRHDFPCLPFSSLAFIAKFTLLYGSYGSVAHLVEISAVSGSL